MKKETIAIIDDEGVEHIFETFSDLIEFVDGFTMSWLPDDFKWYIKEDQL